MRLLEWIVWRVIIGRTYRTIDGTLCVRHWWLAPFRRIYVKRITSQIFISGSLYRKLHGQYTSEAKEWMQLLEANND